MRDRGKVIKQIILDVLKGAFLGLTVVGAMLLIVVLQTDLTAIGYAPGDPEWVSQLPAVLTYLRRGLLAMIGIFAIMYPLCELFDHLIYQPKSGHEESTKTQ